MIYLDSAASAPVFPEALEAAMPFLTEGFGNPSSVHSAGREAALAVIKAREQCAAALCAEPDEMIFTSGGTESDNLAVFSALSACGGKNRIVTTQIEHPAVLNACEEARRRGFEVVYLAPDPEGIISAESASEAIDSRTALVSVMAVNNEIGTIQPVYDIARICRERGALFHVDAVAAAGYMELDTRRLGADYLSISAHKTGGLKGSGLLFARKGAPLSPMIFGGGQERGIRSGTENTAGIAALGAALEKASRGIPERVRRLSALRDLLIKLLEEIPDCRLNGSRELRSCANVNVSFRGVESEPLVMRLDLMGVCASAGSACSAGKQRRSHVIEAIKPPLGYGDGAVRFSLCVGTTKAEILEAARVVKEALGATGFR